MKFCWLLVLSLVVITCPGWAKSGPRMVPYSVYNKWPTPKKTKYIRAIRSALFEFEREQRKIYKFGNLDSATWMRSWILPEAYADGALYCIVGGLRRKLIASGSKMVCPTYGRGCTDYADGFLCGSVYNNKCVERTPIATLSERCQSAAGDSLPSQSVYNSNRADYDMIMADCRDNKIDARYKQNCDQFEKNAKRIANEYGGAADTSEAADAPGAAETPAVDTNASPDTNNAATETPADNTRGSNEVVSGNGEPAVPDQPPPPGPQPLETASDKGDSLASDVAAVDEASAPTARAGSNYCDQPVSGGDCKLSQKSLLSSQKAGAFIEKCNQGCDDLKIISRKDWGAKETAKMKPCSPDNVRKYKVIDALKVDRGKARCQGKTALYNNLNSELTKMIGANEERAPACVPAFSNPTKLVIHHTADTGAKGTANEIQKTHMNKGWSDIGYNFLIAQDKNGNWQAYEGRKRHGKCQFSQAAHAGPGLNSDSLGIAISGNFHKGSDSTPSWKGASGNPEIPAGAAAALAKLTASLKRDCPSIRDIMGHSAAQKAGWGCSQTDCPGNGCSHMVNTLKEKVL